MLDIVLAYLSRELGHARCSLRCGKQLVLRCFGLIMFVLIVSLGWGYSVSVHFGLESSLVVPLVWHIRLSYKCMQETLVGKSSGWVGMWDID